MFHYFSSVFLTFWIQLWISETSLYYNLGLVLVMLHIQSHAVFFSSLLNNMLNMIYIGTSSSGSSGDSLSHAFTPCGSTTGPSDADQQESAMYESNLVHGSLPWRSPWGCLAPPPHNPAAPGVDPGSQAFNWRKLKSKILEFLIFMLRLKYSGNIAAKVTI